MLTMPSVTTKSGEAVHAIVRHGERMAGHILAVIGGVALMFVGLGMGVTMVLLPFGIVVGLVGVLLFVWGIVGHLEKRGNDTSAR